jgi:hypothetical protein
MRHLFVACLALVLSGCAGLKIGMGYNAEAKQFFLQIEKPLESGFKK